MDGMLDRAIEALRSDSSESDALSHAVRARIVQAAWSEASEAAARPGFHPMRWLAIAGVVPVVLAVVLSMIPHGVETARRGPQFVGVQKVGGEVVFTIGDGSGPHQVLRSTDAASFNRRGGQRIADGRYLDRANSGPVVVFYRVD